MKMIKLASLLVAGSLAASSAHANLIMNGSFQTGNFTGWTADPVSFGMYIVTAPSAFVDSGDAYSAQIAGYSYGPDTLSQTVATTPGQDYTLSFSEYIDDGAPTTSLQVNWDGTSVYDVVDTGPYRMFQNVTVSVPLLGSGSDTVEFLCANDPSETYLDNVSLTPTAVPEPTTLISGAMLLLPFGSSAFRQLRKKLQAA
jgi:hypothetical protein